MSLLQNKKVLAYIERMKQRDAEKPAPAPRRHLYTPKEKAQYAVEQRGGDLWMQKWIDWNDKAIPVGKRRVAFVRYLTMTKGYTLERAKYESKIHIR